MRLFGTDGIRDVANTGALAGETLLRIGQALAAVLVRERAARGPVAGVAPPPVEPPPGATEGRGGRVSAAQPGAGPRGGHPPDAAPRPRVLIGRDTRLSGSMIEGALSAGLLGGGVDVAAMGVATTPAVAYCTRTLPFDAGVVVSASHNDFPDNGIKVFSHEGRKLDDATERMIETLVTRGLPGGPRPTGAALGRFAGGRETHAHYVRALVRRFRRRLDRRPRRALVFDAAHGAASELGPEVLRAVGLRPIVLNAAPDGCNINAGCGALHPEALGRRVRAEGAALGAALDGDGDRLILTDERGRVVDGDRVLAFWARHLKARRRLRNALVVSTVMANLGLEQSLAEAGIALLRTPVGDRYVAEEMRACGAVLGGEPSGHLIYDEGFQTTGDGLYSLLWVLAVMQETGRSLSALAACMKPCPQVLINVRVARQPPLETLAPVQTALRAVEAELGGAGRVLLRYSGTEAKARVMVEGRSQAVVAAAAQRIAAALEYTIGVR